MKEFLKNFLGNYYGAKFDYSIKKQVFVVACAFGFIFPVAVLVWAAGQPEPILKTALDRIFDFLIVFIPGLAASYTAGKYVDNKTNGVQDENE